MDKLITVIITEASFLTSYEHHASIMSIVAYAVSCLTKKGTTMYDFLDIVVNREGRTNAKARWVFKTRPVVVFDSEVVVPTAMELAHIRAFGQGDKRKTLIKVARTCRLPQQGTVLATSRRTVESLAAMAVLWDRAAVAEPFDSATEARLDLLQQEALYGHLAWRPTPLPAVQALWPHEGLATAWSRRPLALLQAAARDEAMHLSDRVGIVWRWLKHGEEPNERYGHAVDTERMALAQALNSGEISVGTSGEVALVQARMGAIVPLGHHVKPVVVGFRSNFTWPLGGTGPRVAIAEYSRGSFNAETLLRRLNSLDAVWSLTPKGLQNKMPTRLQVADIVKVVHEHL